MTNRPAVVTAYDPRTPTDLLGLVTRTRGEAEQLMPAPVLRVRLELDRSLRSRAFFARAVAGELTAPEYADLLWQLGTFSSVGAGRGEHRRLAAADVARVRPRDGWRRRACVPVRLLGRALSSSYVSRAVIRRAVDSVLTTSWSEESLEALGRRFAGATSLLEALRVESSYEAPADHGCLAAVTELCAGAWLGVAAYLDRQWPAPTGAVSFSVERA